MKAAQEQQQAAAAERRAWQAKADAEAEADARFKAENAAREVQSPGHTCILSLLCREYDNLLYCTIVTIVFCCLVLHWGPLSVHIDPGLRPQETFG